jgi:hypothetical protein
MSVLEKMPDAYNSSPNKSAAASTIKVGRYSLMLGESEEPFCFSRLWKLSRKKSDSSGLLRSCVIVFRVTMIHECRLGPSAKRWYTHGRVCSAGS